MSRRNETRHTKWHGTCKCQCRLDAIVCNNKQRWNENKCRCECKELIDKGIYEKGYSWNPSNFGSKCDKSCDIGEYLDYESCKCRKKLIDKLVDECDGTIGEEVKIVSESNSCIVYIVLFSMFSTINIGIATYFVYYKYTNRNKKMFLYMIVFIVNIKWEK